MTRQCSFRVLQMHKKIGGRRRFGAASSTYTFVLFSDMLLYYNKSKATGVISARCVVVCPYFCSV